MLLEIREVQSDDEMRQVAGLRYQVTVEEMGLSMQHADHFSRTILEPLDSTGHVFAAWADHQLVATMRQHLLKEADIGTYFDAYGMSRLPTSNVLQMSITTRLAIRQDFRHTKVALLLPEHGYGFLLRNGVQYDVIDSRPHLQPFFRKLGYRQHLPSWSHPEFGTVVVQSLALTDQLHLESVRSPFLKLLRAHQASVCMTNTCT